jgi:2-keto-4-pentenoate hydratase
LSLTSDTRRIAGRFLAARRAAAGLESYPGDFPATLDQAYAIQDAAIASWGRKVIGWKVGRVHPPLSDRFGTDRLGGPIFAATLASEAAGPIEMPVFAEGFAAGESEFLLRVGTAPPEGKTAFTLAEAADLIGAVHVGIEIASSPLGAINELGPIAVISDFGNNNGLLIGAEIADWRSSGFEQWTVATRIDGAEVGIGRAADFPDGAIGAARFLFESMARRGIRLEPGQWISSGAVTGVHRAHPGQIVEARFRQGLSLACRLVAAEPE